MEKFLFLNYKCLLKNFVNKSIIDYLFINKVKKMEENEEQQMLMLGKKLIQNESEDRFSIKGVIKW